MSIKLVDCLPMGGYPLTWLDSATLKGLEQAPPDLMPSLLDCCRQRLLKRWNEIIAERGSSHVWGKLERIDILIPPPSASGDSTVIAVLVATTKNHEGERCWILRRTSD